MNKVIGWVAGILATVIGSCLVYYLTRPPTTTTFEGMVINGEASAPISGALVSLEIKSAANGEPYHDFTDEHGSYRLDFTGLEKSTTVTIAVTAHGFEALAPASIRAAPLDNRRDFVLTPLSAPPRPSGSATGSAHIPVLVHPAYIQKARQETFKVHLQSVP
jgi:hypothetical protein